MGAPQASAAWRGSMTHESHAPTGERGVMDMGRSGGARTADSRDGRRPPRTATGRYDPARPRTGVGAAQR